MIKCCKTAVTEHYDCQTNMITNKRCIAQLQPSGQGQRLGGAAEDGPLQNFRWTGQRCLCPPQKNFKNINFSVFPTVRTGSCALCIVLKLQYYMGYCLSFRFYLFTHRKHLNGTSPKHRGLNAHFQPTPQP